MAGSDAPSSPDWAQYWRADVLPVEAMRAHFTSHVYHRHSHESYSFGVTETGAQAFTCRHGRHVSGPGMVMAFNPDDPHDGHAATDGGFTYRMVHIWPEFFAGLAGPAARCRCSACRCWPIRWSPGRCTDCTRRSPGPPANWSGTSDSPRRPGCWSGTPPGASRAGAPRPGADPGLAARIRALIHDAGDRRGPDRR